MGAKCCIPIRDDTPMGLRKNYSLPNELYLRRNNRCSPSWSFRCDNRTHIEDTADGHAQSSRDGGGVVGSEIEGFSDGSGSSDASVTPGWKDSSVLGKSQSSGGAGISMRSRASDEESKICESSNKSVGSDCEPSSSTICSLSSDKASLSKPCPLPAQLPRQSSKGRLLPFDCLYEEGRQSFASTDSSAGGPHDRSPDGWRSFAELRVSLQMDSRGHSPSSSTSSSDLQSCALCSKLLRERSLYITAVLSCGHVYHAECLETTTSEASKFDPPCPACSNGANTAGKALLKAGSKTRNKISKRAVADIDVDEDFILARQKRLGASSSGKGSFGRSFLRRHFSFGSRSVKLAPGREQRSMKKGLWLRYR